MTFTIAQRGVGIDRESTLAVVELRYHGQDFQRGANVHCLLVSLVKPVA
jgi:hypothetical protein